MRLEYLKSHQLCEGWSEQKCRDLNNLMTQKTYNVNEVIYKRGDRPDYFYILLKGALSMTTQVHLTDSNQIPTGQSTWESYTTERDVEFEIRRVLPNEIFGL
jgi:CRP-like cAMP-binding protein